MDGGACKPSETEAEKFGLLVMALRVCNDFSSTPRQAVMVVAGMISVDILATERRMLCHARCMGARSESYNLRQRRRVESFKGCWIHKLIPNIKVRLEPEH